MKKIAAERNYKIASDPYKEAVDRIKKELDNLIKNHPDELFNSELNAALEKLKQPFPKRFRKFEPLEEGMKEAIDVWGVNALHEEAFMNKLSPNEKREYKKLTDEQVFRHRMER